MIVRAFHRVLILLVVAGGLVIWPAGAGAATVTVSPTSLTFAAQAVGTTSAAQQVTLTKDCTGTNDTLCLPPPVAEGATFNTSIGVPAPFGQTNNCPAALTASPLPPTKVSCTINVTFAPTATGAASGTLATGAGGPTVSLAGTGTPAATAGGKKCKKKKKHKHSASAAKKKCGKKKKK
jgi:hypothetical protein